MGPGALGTFSLQWRVRGGWAELGRRTPAQDQEGRSRSLEGDLGSQPSNVPFSHSWDTDLEGALALGTSGPSGLLLPSLKQGPGGFLSVLVDGGLEPCRAVAKRWHLA